MTWDDEAVDALYTLAPKDFTAARDACAKAARTAGHRERAAEIAALRKPTVVAWLANQLARRRRDAIEPLVELGDSLREATATLSGPELRVLSRRRHQLVQALVRQAREVADDVGQQVSEEVARGLEDTLHAALAEPAAAEQLLAARLSTGLSATGFGTSGDGAVTAAAPRRTAAETKQPRNSKASPGRAPTADDRRRAAERRELEAALAQAWASARSAADAREAAAVTARATGEQVIALTGAAQRLRADLQRAEADLSAAAEAAEHAGSAQADADHVATAARQRVTELQARLDAR